MGRVDKDGKTFEVLAYQPEDYRFLIEMYDNFVPKGQFQGMPPRNSDTTRKWIQGLIKSGVTYLAWRRGKVIGHVVILPEENFKDAEYIIFVSKESRGLGVGHALTDAVLLKAKKMGIGRVWLTVDAYNFKGINLYKKAGFRFHKKYSSASERVMILTLPPKEGND